MTPQELLDEAAIIKNETESGANTAERVGTMFEDIINNAGLPYKVYVAKISQSSTDAPYVVTEYLNTLGCDVSFEYINEGNYKFVTSERIFNSTNWSTNLMGGNAHYKANGTYTSGSNVLPKFSKVSFAGYLSDTELNIVSNIVDVDGYALSSYIAQYNGIINNLLIEVRVYA